MARPAAVRYGAGVGAIKLQCVCGHTLDLPASLAGKQIRCKRCNKVLKVPAAQAQPGQVDLTASGRARIAQELTVQGSRPCPGCGQLYPPSVVICVGCGLNVDSGAMLYASLDDQSGDAVQPEDRRSAAPVGLWGRILRALGLGS